MNRSAAVLIFLLFSASMALADDIKVKPLSFFGSPEPRCQSGTSIPARTFFETKGMGSYSVTLRAYKGDVLTGTYNLGNYYGESTGWIPLYIDGTVQCGVPGVYTLKISFRTTRDGVTKDLFTKIRVY